MALVAVGGYGRGRLCPGSDLDLALVHRRWSGPDIAALADRIWYPLWDTGVRIDHSVRTLREALRLADDEMEVASGLLDARCVWGEPGLVTELLEGTRERWRRSARRRLPELADAVVVRQQTSGDVAFLLEPDLKYGRGGLRDVAAIRAAAEGSPVVEVATGVNAAEAVLLAARVELQRQTRRPTDRLVLEDQDRVAARLGFGDADELMARIAAAARTIGRAGDDSWRRIRSWVAGPRGRQGSADRGLGPGLVLRDGEIVVVGEGDPAADRSLTWRAGAAAAELGVPLARATVQVLAARQPAQVEEWPAAARQALVALLATGRAAIPVFEELDEADILTRLLPEWAPVRSRPQRNALHRFTVDRHLCEAAAEAAGMARRVARPDLLLVGAWLHDIGKGYPGDHTIVGMELVATIGSRIGFAPDDVATLVAMVEHHLLLPDVATRRDLDEPATVDGVAAKVLTAERLELLEALAEADGSATGPAAWSPWKASLVRDLAARVARRLAGEEQPAPPPPFERAQRAVPAARRDAAAAAINGRETAVLVVPDSSTVTVVVPDRPGLLGVIAGTFAVNRVAVLSALCSTSPEGMALDVFDVEHEAVLDEAHLADDLARALDGRLPVAARVAERARAYAGRGRRAAVPGDRRVMFEPASDATIVEVRTPDDLGMLHRVAAALGRCGLNVRSAKVATLGHEVVDTFLVTDGEAPLDPARYAAIETEVLNALADGATVAE
ncbi:MAG: [protein-PII] uridylyltransferase [Acidimicrobiales bacterium]